MDFWQWTAQNWFNLFSVLGITGSLWYSIITFRTATKTQRITNLLTITTNHRAIWKEVWRNPTLKRVLDPSIDELQEPITVEEHLFVNTIVSHMNGVFYATKDGLTIKYEGLQRDAAEFFSLPIPRMIWEKVKSFQNDDFAAFIESSRQMAKNS